MKIKMFRYKADAHIFSSLLASSPGLLRNVLFSSWCTSCHSGDHWSLIHLKEKEVGTMIIPCLDGSGNIEKLYWECGRERLAGEEGMASDGRK